MSGSLHGGYGMISFAYPAKFVPDKDGRPVVSFPDFPEAHTDGKDMQEAIEEAIDCLGSAISARISHKQELPNPSPLKRGQRIVPVPFWVAGKLALHLAMRDAHVSNVALARKLGVTELVVRRMLTPKHATKPEKIQAALEALGKTLVVGLKDAA